ncbi:MAG TPA: hypothetical protein VK167_08200 [Flavipsychrobacter sp.]|nr:hypothetical protein [Flavipsychrobacter sp.]
MPYQESNRLPAERASKLGHLEVIQSPLVQKLCQNFNDPTINNHDNHSPKWEQLPNTGKELKYIFSSDGSLQITEQSTPPYKAIAFVKTALFKVDQYAVDKIDKDIPHPLALRDLMKDSALYHATAFPLRNVYIDGKSNYDAIRGIVYESIKDNGLNSSLNGAMMDTLKWIAYEKWSVSPKTELERFGCPHCKENSATLPYDAEIGKCPNCDKEIFITDMFGFHLTMTEDYAPNQIASDYMAISETMMIFTPIRYYWDNHRTLLNDCLFIKDGPLSLRATLAKLAAPIYRFFDYAKTIGVEIAMFGQEKSGVFFDHLQLIGNVAPTNSIFIPDNKYIREDIQHSTSDSEYGADTNYGAKVFLKLNERHKMVIMVPTGKRGNYVHNPDIKNLIGIYNILTTLPSILSNRFEGAILPIELANKIASLSTYPSAKTLELFAEANKGK